MGFKRLIVEIHQRSVWQVLAIYLLSAAAAFQVIQSLTEGLDLPRWFPALAVVLFVVLLPVVLATASVREERPAAAARTAAVKPARAAQATEGAGAVREAMPAAPPRRVFGWRRVVVGVLGVFALWGLVATGWLIVGGLAPGRGAAERGLPVLRTKLVVLPFENLGPTADEYFTDGVTEEIASRLSEIPELGVISRTSAAQYKQSAKSLREIAAELDVEYVLEGTVRWERTPDGRSQVRVTPQLIRVVDDTNVWTARFDAILAEIFRIQSEIAESVARALDLTVLEPQRRAIEARPTENLAAYDAYLRGNDAWARRFNEADTRQAISHYERAAALDPSFVRAHAALARARVWLSFQFGRAAELPRARAAVDEAVRLAPDLHDTHMALGVYHYYGERDYEAALEEYAEVLRRRPNEPDAIAATAWIQRRRSEWENSIANAERALELDPRNTVYLIGQAQTLYYVRRFAEAEVYFQRALSLGPEVAYYHRWTAAFYLAWDGSVERAQRTLEDGFRHVEPGTLFIGPEVTWIVTDLFGADYLDRIEAVRLGISDVDSADYYLAKGEVYAQLGRAEAARGHYDSARAILEARIAATPTAFAPYEPLGLAYAGLGRFAHAIRAGRRAVEQEPVSSDAMNGSDRLVSLARIYVKAGERDAAIDVLEQALAVPSQISLALLHLDPFWDPLRDHPRFQGLMQELPRERERAAPLPTAQR